MPESWNYPYQPYKGFIIGSINGGSYSQRNVFLYPPQTTDRCNDNDKTQAASSDACGTNGGAKKFFADQTATTCDKCKPGTLSGPFFFYETTTDLVGADNALLYQVFNPLKVDSDCLTNCETVPTLQSSQLTTITKSLDGTTLRTRTQQGYNSNNATVSGPGIAGAAYRASFYREKSVSQTDFFDELDSFLVQYDLTEAALKKLCYGANKEEAIANLKLFLQGANTWPLADKYECPPQPLFRQMAYAVVSGNFAKNSLVCLAQQTGENADQKIAGAEWKPATLVFTAAGATAGYFPGKSEGELVMQEDVNIVQNVNIALCAVTIPTASGFQWFEVKNLVWTDLGVTTLSSASALGDPVTFDDRQEAKDTGNNFLWQKYVNDGYWKVQDF